MSYDPNEYDIEAAYAQDPDAVTNAVIAEAAAIAAAEVAELRIDHREEDFQRLTQAQVESATIAAVGDLKARYGSDEWERIRPRVEERIQQAPHLVPAEVRTSPSALAKSLDDVYKLARGEQAEQDRLDTWEKIKASNPNVPRFWR